MIKKRRCKPYQLLCYEALFRRLKNKFRDNPVINHDYINVLSGYIGEQQVDYILNTHPQQYSHLYHDLRLKNHQYYFQMDTVLLSSKFILILEIKNWKGILTYHSNLKHITQTYNNSEKSYRNPISQVHSHKLQLQYWLQQVLGIYGVPIETFVVISDPATILKNPQDDPQFYNTVIYADNLPSKLDELWMKYQKNSLSKTVIHTIHKSFMTLNEPYHPNLINHYKIDDNYLIHGIECEICGQFPMKRINRKWHCENCSYVDKSAHERALLDYFLLFKTTITNKECREFLKLDSSKVAYSLLQSMNLEKTGTNRGRKYLAPKREEYPQQSVVPNKKREIMLV